MLLERLLYPNKRSDTNGPDPPTEARVETRDWLPLVKSVFLQVASGLEEATGLDVFIWSRFLINLARTDGKGRAQQNVCQPGSVSVRLARKTSRTLGICVLLQILQSWEVALLLKETRLGKAKGLEDGVGFVCGNKNVHTNSKFSPKC